MTEWFPPETVDPLAYFEALVADDQDLNLIEAAAAIAQDDDPGLDVQQVLADLDRLGERLRARLPADASPTHRLRLLTHFFHVELGFAGNVNDYYAAANSYLHRVLATRRGLPITLALIFMELGSHAGLRIQGVGFPGHFLMRLSLPQGDVVLDPFSGRSLARHELDEMLASSGRPDLPLEMALRTLSSRQVLARVLRNLKEVHRGGSDWHALLAVQNRLVLLLPHDGPELRERAQTLELLGEREAAAADLTRCLGLAASAVERRELERRLERLRRFGGPTLH
ncbi:transglutaminase-like domain-containing protein [Pelomonas sp. CA6]|uniref:SirB1 family protein n=1 Tax=Pelomonas sp. CA6 TaxID=2907999 RepID=UPI001F4C3834|nr:transglutaminase-like domain-containing protein [Pelomonas sp. CA6]MCH7344231.1 transglutaminase-like domain-containing protein [Pelomonas sp. CA6]